MTHPNPIVFSCSITCDAHGSVMLDDVLIGGVEYEPGIGWTAINFYEDQGWENNEHDEPYSSCEEAVRAVVMARWALFEEVFLASRS